MNTLGALAVGFGWSLVTIYLTRDIVLSLLVYVAATLTMQWLTKEKK